MPRTSTRRLVPLFVAFVLSTAVFLPLQPEPASARDGSTLVNIVNRYRAAAPVAAVSLHSVVDQISVERADQLAAGGKLTHDLAHVKNRLSEAGVCWQRVGEIIAYNTMSSLSDRLERFVKQWYDSTKGHKELMLNAAYTHAGGSWTTGSDGRHYAAMIFITSCGGSSSGFADVGSSAFKSEIEWLVSNKVTAGCTADRYCPTRNVTRDQMASFVRRATGVPAQYEGWFADVNGSVHRTDINGVAAAGIAAGCTAAKYCPTSVVTRGQMASFLARALDLPAATRDWFRDDSGSVHEGAINRLAEAGITGGCASGAFCPDAPVTREQMAGFLYRAFGR